MKNEIKTTVVSIIYILSHNDATAWAKIFEELNVELENDYEAALSSLRSVFGGAGSFTDFVLHKNKVPLTQENNELYALKNKLYNLLKVELAKINSHKK